MTRIREALAGACLCAFAHAASAGEVLAAPAVPVDVQVPAGNELFLSAHAIGTQDYVCLPSPAGLAWSLFTPRATLFGSDAQQAMTHFFSPNAAENDTVRATWQDSADSSLVWARVVKPSSDAAFVQAGAIPWVLLEVSGARKPSGRSTRLTDATFVQRINTTGGAAPAAGCAAAEDVGKKAYVAYTADYLFYRRRS